MNNLKVSRVGVYCGKFHQYFLSPKVCFKLRYFLKWKKYSYIMAITWIKKYNKMKLDWIIFNKKLYLKNIKKYRINFKEEL